MAASAKPKSLSDLPPGMWLSGEIGYGKTTSAKAAFTEMLVEAITTQLTIEGEGDAKPQGAVFIHCDVEGTPPPVPAGSRYFTRKGLYSDGWLTRDQRFVFKRSANGRHWSIAPSIYSKQHAKDRQLLAGSGLLDAVFPSRRVAYEQLQLLLATEN